MKVSVAAYILLVLLMLATDLILFGGVDVSAWLSVAMISVFGIEARSSTPSNREDPFRCVVMGGLLFVVSSLVGICGQMRQVGDIDSQRALPPALLGAITFVVFLIVFLRSEP